MPDPTSPDTIRHRLVDLTTLSRRFGMPRVVYDMGSIRGMWDSSLTATHRAPCNQPGPMVVGVHVNTA